MNLDYLAYGILALVYIFIITPFIGATEDRYSGALILGAFVQLMIIGMAGAIFAVVWAVSRVLS